MVTSADLSVCECLRQLQRFPRGRISEASQSKQQLGGYVIPHSVDGFAQTVFGNFAVDGISMPRGIGVSAIQDHGGTAWLAGRALSASGVDFPCWASGRFLRYCICNSKVSVCDTSDAGSVGCRYRSSSNSSSSGESFHEPAPGCVASGSLVVGFCCCSAENSLPLEEASSQAATALSSSPRNPFSGS
jgi:hypothetical protein